MRLVRAGGWMGVVLVAALAGAWLVAAGCDGWDLKNPWERKTEVKEPLQKKVPPDIAQFDAKGNLVLPADFRSWVFIGAPVTPNDLNEGKALFAEFHNVYIDPDSFSYYKRTGRFRDGTVLVKELVTVGEKKASSGNGYFPGKFNGVAVAVKSAEWFPKEPGHWAYFNFGGEGGSAHRPVASAAPTSSCNACHLAGPAEDWVFTQYYPVLKAARAAARHEAAPFTPITPTAAPPSVPPVTAPKAAPAAPPVTAPKAAAPSATPATPPASPAPGAAKSGTVTP